MAATTTTETKNSNVVGVVAGSRYRLRLRNAAQIVAICSKRERFIRGRSMDKV
jgi:hypothetical protein